MGQIISITNQKGGVGKTTTAVNLSAFLSNEGSKVLLVDLDPQGNTTSGLGFEKSQIKRSLYDILLNDLLPQEAIIKTNYKNLHLIPSHVVLAAAEVEMVAHLAREYRLKQALDKIKDQYDYIFIDSPPSLGLLTINGLVASDKILYSCPSRVLCIGGTKSVVTHRTEGQGEFESFNRSSGSSLDYV
jgi:chromosome partitioning protein